MVMNFLQSTCRHMIGNGHCLVACLSQAIYWEYSGLLFLVSIPVLSSTIYSNPPQYFLRALLLSLPPPDLLLGQALISFVSEQGCL